MLRVSKTIIKYCEKNCVTTVSKHIKKTKSTPRTKLKLWCVRCHHPELFPLLAKVPETKTETVSTKLSELPQTTTYHTITYKAHIGPCPLHRTEVRTNWGLAPYIGPKSEADWDLVPYIKPKSEADWDLVPYIGPKSEVDWDLVPYIGPKSEAD